MLALIASPLGRILITVSVALLMVAGAYIKGLSDGKRIARQGVLEESVKADADRRKVDAEVNSRRSADLCRSLGLPVDKISECVRRMEQANPGP